LADRLHGDRGATTVRRRDDAAITQDSKGQADGSGAQPGLLRDGPDRGKWVAGPEFTVTNCRRNSIDKFA
jgi:hypothetical protein